MRRKIKVLLESMAPVVAKEVGTAIQQADWKKAAALGLTCVALYGVSRLVDIEITKGEWKVHLRFADQPSPA